MCHTILIEPFRDEKLNEYFSLLDIIFNCFHIHNKTIQILLQFLRGHIIYIYNTLVYNCKN